jgi:hypothetical protein
MAMIDAAAAEMLVRVVIGTDSIGAVNAGVELWRTTVDGNGRQRRKPARHERLSDVGLSP